MLRESTTVRYLTVIGKVPKLGACYGYLINSRKETESTETVRVMTLANFQRGQTEWLDSIIIGNKKLVLYVNVTRKHEWLVKETQPEPQPKVELHESQDDAQCLIGFPTRKYLLQASLG